MRVYFKNSKGLVCIEEAIGTCDTYEQANEIIHAFLDEHNFRSYYQKWYDDENGRHIDVGSHTEFFRVK